MNDGQKVKGHTQDGRDRDRNVKAGKRDVYLIPMSP